MMLLLELLVIIAVPLAIGLVGLAVGWLEP